MLILNEEAYCFDILSGDFTNRGALMPKNNFKYYIPIVCACWNKSARVLRKFAAAIDNCGISNFTGDSFMLLFDQWKNSWRAKHPDWQGALPMLSGQTVQITPAELDCLFSIKSKSTRAKNLAALFLIKYLSLKFGKSVKFPYALVCELCGVKEGAHSDKYSVMRQDFGIIPVRGKRGVSTLWEYDPELMAKYHEGLSVKRAARPFPIRFDGDYIWHRGIPFEHNGAGILSSFELLRREVFINCKTR